MTGLLRLLVLILALISIIWLLVAISVLLLRRLTLTEIALVTLHCLVILFSISFLICLNYLIIRIFQVKSRLNLERIPRFQSYNHVGRSFREKSFYLIFWWFIKFSKKLPLFQRLLAFRRGSRNRCFYSWCTKILFYSSSLLLLCNIACYSASWIGWN